jgi:hypothetical protein
MKKLTLSTLAVALAFAAAPAFADQPTGLGTNSNSGSNGSPVGQASSAYTQNGWVIGGNHGNADVAGIDQTTSPGSRPNGPYGPQELLGK